MDVHGSCFALKTFNFFFTVVNSNEGLETIFIFILLCNEMQELAIDPIPQCLTSPLANLRMVRVDMKDYFEWEFVVSDFDKEIVVFKCLLQSTPALETMEIQIPEYVNEAMNKFTDFLLKLSEVSTASAQTKICVKKILKPTI